MSEPPQRRHATAAMPWVFSYVLAGTLEQEGAKRGGGTGRHPPSTPAWAQLRSPLAYESDSMVLKASALGRLGDAWASKRLPAASKKGPL
jgi:hypothetical protein